MILHVKVYQYINSLIDNLGVLWEAFRIDHLGIFELLPKTPGGNSSEKRLYTNTYLNLGCNLSVTKNILQNYGSNKSNKYKHNFNSQ